MALASLQIDSLRCVEAARLELAPRLTVIQGPNGSGKTSILESIFLLGRGRSFRTRFTERLVRRGTSRFQLFGETVDPRLVLARNVVLEADTMNRVDGRTPSSLA
ncbi:DNA replication and repair protein RecF, partial [bacterium]